MNYLHPKTYSVMAVAFATGLTLSATTTRAAEQDWKAGLISPVANPIYFEDPRVDSEIHPIFMQHWLPATFHYSGGTVPLGGDVRVYAVQLRAALTERLGLIATKDGYIEFKPKGALASNHGYGFADLALGLKYVLVDDAAKQLILTPGLTITVPTGSHAVFQGNNAGEWNLFVSAAKGFNNFHVMGNLGFRIPNNFDDQTAQAHYSLQLDYRTCQYFTPFVAMNGYTMLSNGKNKLLGSVPLNTEMYDLINFGSTDVAGRTQIVLGGGFRSQLAKKVDVGVAYEAGVTSPKGIFDSRLTVDMILRF